ncbi:acyl transferase domain-containing protein [Mycena rosella]|uniref:Acyl transferase domain-containing protein n=1 Tax=Mycena rosella TaxID=1033263 RepID=A0AAD7GJ68_MYCRO|nr:acyl transferase domain-containing protein [Mycena rosella]
MDYKQAKIAIVGVAAQLPSGDYSLDDLDYRSYWDFLMGKRQAYEDIRPELFDSSQFSDQQTKLNLPSKGAFLKNPGSLDTIGLGISVKDARVMPFTGRRLMEKSVEALLDSGIDYRNQRVGCFMSGTSRFELEGPLRVDGSFAFVPSALANRISHLLDITGPSLLVDTACSSSLTALHLAILAIESGDCTAALVGAAQVNRELAEWKNYEELLAPDGKTKPFDAGANGAVAQKDCIQRAYARARRNVVDVDYAELHITGTSVGDCIEANTAGEVFARDTDVAVGSVKGNIGHLESAAFLVSLLKACLILEHKIIPPSVNFAIPSPKIDWNSHRLLVVTEPTALECHSHSDRSIISLSGAGLGGSTGHVVVESPPARGDALNPPCAHSTTVTFTVGGLSPKAVAQICQSIRGVDFSNLENMRACAVTLSRRARQMPWRTYFKMPISPGTEITPASLVAKSSPPIAFVFSGQGPQNFEMGRGLFAEFPVFRATILELDDVFRGQMGVSLLETMGLFICGRSTPPPFLTPTVWPVTTTLAATAMLQIALVDLLSSVGVVPSTVVGHSAGETVVLYASGAGSKAMALEIAIARGQAMSATESADVGMASLACSAGMATRMISKIPGVTRGIAEIACLNSPNSVVVSGSAELLNKLITSAQAAGIFARRLATMVAAHSSVMDRIKDDYMSRMIKNFNHYPGPRIPTIPVFSPSSGQVLVGEFTPSYFWDNCRKCVLFSSAISNLLDFHSPGTDSSTIVVLEISCHPVLSSSIQQHGAPEKSVLCPMRRSSANTEAPQSPNEPILFAETLAQITLLGYNSCDLSGLYGATSFKPSFLDHPFATRSVPSPKMQFTRNRGDTMVNSPLSMDHLLINERTHPTLAQHVINGEPILPATCFIEILLEAGANHLWDVEFRSVFSLAARNPGRVTLERSYDNWTLKSMKLGPNMSASLSRVLAHGLMDCSPPVRLANVLDLKALWARLPRLDMEGFYQSLSPFAKFGPAFQRVLRCHGGPSEVITEIKGPSLDDTTDQYRIHPVILDACLHVMLHREISKQSGSEGMYLPSKLGHFTYHGSAFASGNWFSHIRRRLWSPNSKCYDILVTDASGVAICEFKDLVMQKLAIEIPPVHRRFDLVFQPISVPVVVVDTVATYSTRGKQLEIRTLFAVLDSLARKIIANSLQQQIRVGNDPSRQRYFDFAKRALQTNAPELAYADSIAMQEKYPAYFDVTERISKVHGTVFYSPKTAVDTLYSDDLMARFYSRSTQDSTVYQEAVDRFSNLLRSLQENGKRTINILEVGAGTGLLTNYLIDELKQHPDLLAEYTVTDASYALAAELSRTIPYHKITPKLYNLTEPPDIQGLLSESYDVIVALHVLHAVPHIQTCLLSLQSLLVPGGSLLVIEIDGTSWDERPGSVWHDFVFGSFSEWFGFADGRTHCTMAPTVWMAELAGLGFVNNHASVEDGGHDFLFTAQKHSSSIQQAIPDSDLGIDPRCVLQYSVGNEMELQSRLAEMSPKDHIALYVFALAGLDGDSAMGLCATLRREFPFWDIHLALFETATQFSSPLRYISGHRVLFKNGEHVLYFPHQGSGELLRPVISPLFLHDKSYVLLGGIGGLGIDLAVWMYQHGARHIILTSRRGMASLHPQTDGEALAKVAYLRRCDDLVLRLEKCDATNEQETSLLVKSIILPLAGCFQMTLVLADALFSRQTSANFTTVHDSKIRVFEVFAAEVDITSLDFYIAFSSLTGLIGYAGQSHYASACTGLVGVLSSHRNAFSLVVPGILDAGYLDRTESGHVDRTNGGIFSVSTSMSAARLWNCIQDGLLKIREGSSPTQYIPDLDWDSLHARSPLPVTFHHLLSSHRHPNAFTAAGLRGEEDVLQIVLSFVEVEQEDFDFERPLLSYGLDSLSATKLSSALQPFIPVSQVQLLAGISWSELSTSLKTRPQGPDTRGGQHKPAREILMAMLGVDETDFDPNIPLISYGLDSLSASKLAAALRPYLPVTQLQLLAHTTWADLLNMSVIDHDRPSLLADTIVELCSGTGIPLILFCGGNGSLAPLLALRSHFSGTLWGIQVTDSTPTTSFPVLVAFFVQKIREKQPNGPYRLAAYSASGVICVAVTKLLEESGQQVLQLSFIDHFPLLWTNEAAEKMLRELEIPALVDRLLTSTVALLREDPLHSGSEQIEQLEAALMGVSNEAATEIATTGRLATPIFQLLAGKAHSGFADSFTSWVSSVNAPLSVLIAEFGMITTVPNSLRESWADLGASQCHSQVKQQIITGVGHYGILADKRTTTFLQQYIDQGASTRA